MANTSSLPLCIDLDGTLMHSDALVESAMRSLFRSPFKTLLGCTALRHGRAAFKARMLQHGDIDVSLLPYNTPLIERLQSEKAAGRTLVLVTAADQRVAHAVQAHLGLFDEVFASDGKRNLKGPQKGAFLAQRYGEGGFIYAGDALADRAVWRHAAAAWTVGAKGLAAAREVGVIVEAQFDSEIATARDWFSALGVDKWIWNLLVFIPIFFAGNERAWSAPVIATFALFCLVAAGGNLINALARLEQMRRHPERRTEPISAGRISLVQAGMIAAGLIGVGCAAGLLLTPKLGVVLLVFALSSALLCGLPTRLQSLAWALGTWLAVTRVLGGQSVAAVNLSWQVWAIIVAALAIAQRVLPVRHHAS